MIGKQQQQKIRITITAIAHPARLPEFVEHVVELSEYAAVLVQRRLEELQ